jgi:RNase P/RNase MRP subunit p29
MRRARSGIAGLFLAGLLLSPVARAETPDKYQVTGQVVEVTDSMIVVMKGKERFEMARDASTKVTGDLQVGAKITAKYRITATTVEVKAEKKK